MIINTLSSFADLDLCNFHNFRLNQYHLKIEGLWVSRGFYYIHCPDINNETLAIDGSNIHQWFRDYSLVGTRTILTNQLPQNATKVKDFSLEDSSQFAGLPKNFTFLFDDLLFSLPRSFPDFKLTDNNTGIVKFLTLRQLTDIEEKQLSEAVHKMQLSIIIETQVVDSFNDIYQPILDDPLLLRHSKSLDGLKGKSSKMLWEEDEDFWSMNKLNILKPKSKKEDFYPDKFHTNSSSCLIEDYFSPFNLRSFLTLYNIVYLNLPISEFYDSYLSQLGVSEKELIELAQLGRVRFILPESLARYNSRIIDAISELPRNSYLLTRRLSCITIADLRRRNPLLYPTFEDEIKYQLLHELHHKQFAGKLPNELSQNFPINLSRIWDNYLEDVHRGGAYALRTYSSFHFIDSLFKDIGRDFEFELLTSIPSVDFGAALQANIIPRYKENRKHSNEKIVSLIANVYSGLPNDFVPTNFPYSNTTIDQILVINKDVPVIDLANSFNNNDINRFRNLIFGLTKHKKNDGELASALELFNQHVKNYESASKRRETVNISGFLIDGSLDLMNPGIPLASWIINGTKALLTQIGVNSKVIQSLIDNLESINTGTDLPDAILVSRMRNQLKESWFQSKLRKLKDI